MWANEPIAEVHPAGLQGLGDADVAWHDAQAGPRRTIAQPRHQAGTMAALA